MIDYNSIEKIALFFHENEEIDEENLVINYKVSKENFNKLDYELFKQYNNKMTKFQKNKTDKLEIKILDIIFEIEKIK